MLRHGRWVILVSLLIALMLMVLPLPEWGRPLRPAWTALVLIYWCMALPERVGVGVAWATGLLQDAMTGALLGQHAMSLAVVAFLALRFHQRVRIFPLRQQILAVLGLLLVYQLLNLWVMGVAGRSPQSWTFWGASLVGTLLWPWVFLLLRRLRRLHRVR